MKSKIRQVCQFILLSGVRIYRTLLSPLMVPTCRYLPTCSEYALDAIGQHGPWRGLVLTMKRLKKCHPWGGHGLDFVPEKTMKHRD